MNVKEIGAESPPLVFGKKGKQEDSEGKDFQKTLEQAHSQFRGSPAPPASAGDGGWAEGLAPITFPLLPSDLSAGATPLQSLGVQATERTLGLLEQYQKALSDPGVSLKEVFPLVQALRQEAQGMNRWTDQLPPSDPLRKIMGEIGILSSVEIEKFNRGDYV